MKLTLEIQMDNAAFEETPELETGRILIETARKLRCETWRARTFGLYDFNGNKVGSVAITAEEMSNR